MHASAVDVRSRERRAEVANLFAVAGSERGFEAAAKSGDSACTKAGGYVAASNVSRRASGSPAEALLSPSLGGCVTPGQREVWRLPKV
jgi:hypothetical protein